MGITVDANSMRIEMTTRTEAKMKVCAASLCVSGLKKACEKRPISMATIEAVADRIEKRLQELGEAEVASPLVGEEVMKELSQLDQVAYVRFASVYREFKDIDQFMDEIKALAQQRRER